MTVTLSEDTAGWPPEGRLFPIRRFDLRILPGDHPVLGQAEAIAENWARETAANPALFDGRLMFFDRMAVSSEGVFAEGYSTPFSAFMWWRREPRTEGFHIFAYPVLATSDGALVAIRMGPKTANAGQVYFAAGSLEDVDVIDGRCDVEKNMRREVLEETGIDLDEAEGGEGYHAVHIRRRVTLVKLFRFRETADALIARIEAHIRVAEEEEIAGAVAIRSADPTAHPYNAAMLPIIEWYFSRAEE